jgi:hypothetical protein
MAELEESVKTVVTELADKVVEEVTNTDKKSIEPSPTEEVVVKAVEEVVVKAVEEVVVKAVEEVVVKAIEEELKIIEPVVYTVPAEAVLTQGLEMVGVKMITESSLSEDQKKLATSIYESVKAAIKEFISDPSINETIKITKTIAKLVKELENAKVDGKAPSGADKKAVAIQLGRILIKEVITNDSLEANILMVYDVVAEPTLEAMIEVSKVVNVVVQKVATSCGPSFNKLLQCLRLKKN